MNRIVLLSLLGAMIIGSLLPRPVARTIGGASVWGMLGRQVTVWNRSLTPISVTTAHPHAVGWYFGKDSIIWYEWDTIHLFVDTSAYRLLLDSALDYDHQITWLLEWDGNHLPPDSTHARKIRNSR